MLQQPEAQGVQRYIGGDLLASDGDKIGSVREFINDRITEVPAWIMVSSGLLGTNYVVPVAGSSFEDGRVVVPYPANLIREEPQIEDASSITPEAEAILGAYFGLGAAETPSAG